MMQEIKTENEINNDQIDIDIIALCKILVTECLCRILGKTKNERRMNQRMKFR